MIDNLKPVYVILYRSSEEGRWNRAVEFDSLAEAQKIFSNTKEIYRHARLMVTNVRSEVTISVACTLVDSHIGTGIWGDNWITLQSHDKISGREILNNRIPQYFKGRSYRVFSCAADDSCAFVRVDRGDNKYTTHLVEVVEVDVRVSQIATP